jgi:hypothetical protein
VGLIEIIVALTILSIAMMALGSLMFQTARHTNVGSAVALRSAAGQNAAHWASSLPWDSIPLLSGWSEDTIAGVVFRRSVSCDTGCPSSSCPTCAYRKIRITVTAQGITGGRVRPDTVYVVRASPRTTAPLKVR